MHCHHHSAIVARIYLNHWPLEIPCPSPLMQKWYVDQTVLLKLLESFSPSTRPKTRISVLVLQYLRSGQQFQCYVISTASPKTSKEIE